MFGFVGAAKNILSSKPHAVKNNVFFLFWSIISFLAIANLLVFDLTVLFAPETLRVQFVPDDAYYYLQLAKNFVNFSYWTFDSGVSVASGFHPLLAYLLVLLYKLFQPAASEFVVWDVALTCLFTLLLTVWIWWIGFKRQNTPVLICLTLCVGARSFLFNSVSGVEWPLVLLFAALYCLFFYETTDLWEGSAKIFAAGLLLSLARTDTGLFPFALFLATFALSSSKLGEDKAALAKSFSGLAGSVTGLGLVFLHNYLFTDHFIQSSARMKYYWSQFGGSSLGMTLTLPLRTIGFDYYFNSSHKLLSGIPFLFLYVLVSLLILQKRNAPGQRSAWSADPQIFKKVALFIAALTSAMGYTFIYMYDGVIQNWYTANFVLPIFILGVGLLSYTQNISRDKIDWLTGAVSVITLITLVLNLLWTYPLQARSPWPHQQVMFEAGTYLAQHPLEGRVAAWNAGVLGYYQGGTLINIDGLVNNDIYPYAVSNNLPAYLEKTGIRYIVDFELMFSPGFRQRGGYDVPGFLQKLQPLIVFDQGQFPSWQFLTIYQISN
jgi:hypothetical protein